MSSCRKCSKEEEGVAAVNWIGVAEIIVTRTELQSAASIKPPTSLMRYLLWFVILDTWNSNGEWVELPTLNPSRNKEKKTQNIMRTKERKGGGSNNNSLPLDINFQQILLQVHKVLATEGKSTIDKKENFLENLQKRMLSDIWGKSHDIWSRTGVEGRGHSSLLSFPSLEGALMTISFLTFAVFLIKIVKQFIQGLQGNSGTLIGIELPVNMAAPAKVIKHKRNAAKTKDAQCSKLNSNHYCPDRLN